jgi:hypothetical protein
MDSSYFAGPVCAGPATVPSAATYFPGNQVLSFVLQAFAGSGVIWESPFFDNRIFN